jgi:segregation and condensation protein B
MPTETNPETDLEQLDTPPARTKALDPATFTACVETALITTQRPLGLGRISQIIIEAGMPEAAAAPNAVNAAIEQLNADYTNTNRAFRIESVAGGFRMMTLGDFAPVAAAVRGLSESTRLSRAAIETLAIVAYRQPVTRVDIESIRGSATGEVLRTLLDKRLVTIVGRAEELGRPMLYGTTKRFLEIFGLSSIRDLPPAAEGLATARDSGRKLESIAEAKLGGGTVEIDDSAATLAAESEAHHDTEA